MDRRTLAELRDVAEPAWPLVAAWFAAARNAIEVLPADRARAEQTLLHLQVTAGSPLGAIALETGGVLVDGGWLRLLGSGNARLRGSLYSWNGGAGGAANAPLAQALIVAHDAAGGFFALNGGAFPGARGAVHYFAPDTLRWEDLELSYSDLLTWAAGGDLRGFYAGAHGRAGRTKCGRGRAIGAAGRPVPPGARSRTARGGRRRRAAPPAGVPGPGDSHAGRAGR